MNKKKLINQINIYRSVLILLVICVFATILSPSFLSVTNLFNVFKQITVAGIVGCGMTFVILTGGIDLSVGSILGLSGVLASGVLASTGNTAAAVAVSLHSRYCLRCSEWIFRICLWYPAVYFHPWYDDVASRCDSCIHKGIADSDQIRCLQVLW